VAHTHTPIQAAPSRLPLCPLALQPWEAASSLPSAQRPPHIHKLCFCRPQGRRGCPNTLPAYSIIGSSLPSMLRTVAIEVTTLRSASVVCTCALQTSLLATWMDGASVLAGMGSALLGGRGGLAALDPWSLALRGCSGCASANCPPEGAGQAIGRLQFKGVFSPNVGKRKHFFAGL